MIQVTDISNIYSFLILCKSMDVEHVQFRTNLKFLHIRCLSENKEIFLHKMINMTNTIDKCNLSFKLSDILDILDKIDIRSTMIQIIDSQMFVCSFDEIYAKISSSTTLSTPKVCITFDLKKHYLTDQLYNCLKDKNYMSFNFDDNTFYFDNDHSLFTDNVYPTNNIKKIVDFSRNENKNIYFFLNKHSPMCISLGENDSSDKYYFALNHLQL